MVSVRTEKGGLAYSPQLRKSAFAQNRADWRTHNNYESHRDAYPQDCGVLDNLVLQFRVLKHGLQSAPVSAGRNRTLEQQLPWNIFSNRADLTSYHDFFASCEQGITKMPNFWVPFTEDFRVVWSWRSFYRNQSRPIFEKLSKNFRVDRLSSISHRTWWNIITTWKCAHKGTLSTSHMT